MPTKKDDLNLEKSMAELEKLVETMESGKLSLEESLKLFEKGVSITKTCQTTLKKIEQKVQILQKENDQLGLTDFNEDEE
jgi:exodeoxyribonuclease VII small subunit